MSTETLRRFCPASSVRPTGIRCSTCGVEVIRGIHSNPGNDHVGFACLACDCARSSETYARSGGYGFDFCLNFKRAWDSAALSLLARQKVTP